MNGLLQYAVTAIAAMTMTWLLLRGLGRAPAYAAERGMSGAGNRGAVLNSMGHGGGFLGGLLGGMGHGGHEGHADANDAGRPPENRPATVPEAAIDPVSGEAVATARALTSVYQGSIYYFASKETRDRFEAAPQEYAQKASGHAVASPEPGYQPPRRRRGC